MRWPALVIIDLTHPQPFRHPPRAINACEESHPSRGKRDLLRH